MADFFVLCEDVDGQQIKSLRLEQPVQAQLSNVLQQSAESLGGDVALFELDEQAFTPDETEAWVIGEFALPDYVSEAVANPIGCPTLTPSSQKNSRIKAFVAKFEDANSGTWLAFQALDRRNLLRPEGFNLIFNGEVYDMLTEPGLQIGEDVHCTWDETNGLIFRKMFWAGRVFDLSQHYIEASKEDVDAFLDHDSLVVEDPDGLADSMNQWARKRVRLILQRGILDEYAPTLVSARASKFGIKLAVEDDKLVVPSTPKELRAFLKFLEEDYFVGPLSEKKYVANSKTTIAS